MSASGSGRLGVYTASSSPPRLGHGTRSGVAVDEVVGDTDGAVVPVFQDETAAQQSAAARARWTARAEALGFDSLDDYLADRRDGGATAHRIRTELRCGGSTADMLLAAAM